MMKTKMLSIQKMVAMIIATLIMVLSVSSYQMNAEAANTERYYRVFNAQTGSLLREYKLDPLESVTNTNTRTVILPDDRDEDWSKSGVVKLMTSTLYAGTGFVVDEHTIATAAHCLWQESITEILLFDSNGEITLHATPVEYHIPEEYCNNQTGNYDYALITVEEDLSDYACFNLGVTVEGFSATNSTVYVAGFPQEVEDETVNGLNNHMMYVGEGRILNMLSPSHLCYNTDTSGGNSGGPAYLSESRCGYTYYTVIAVHTSGFGTYNAGTRITTDLIHFYNNNPNLNWE